MIFHTVNVEMNKSDNAASARVILDFFVFQQQAAIENYAMLRGEYEGAIAANERGRKVYKEESYGLGCGGFGYKDPINEYQLEQMKNRMESAKKDVDDAKRLYMFIRERFVDKFIEPATTSFSIINNDVESPYWQENYVRLNRNNK